MRRIAIFFLAMVVICIGLALLTEEWADGDLARLFYLAAYACTFITAPAIVIARAERTPNRKKAAARDEERPCGTVSEPHLSGMR